MSWVKFCLGSNGSLHSVKCKICIEVERKDKILVGKWDSLCKHICWQKDEKNIRTNVKKGELYYSQNSKHAKNHKLLASHSGQNIATQLGNGDAREKGIKVVQFATIFHLLQQGCPMLEYEAIKPLYEFLVVPTTNKKHWSDNSRWTIAKFIH